MSQDTNVENLIINKLTKAQFESITTPDPTQLYFITDEVISSADITNALGYIPYNATNPNGYIDASALNGYATQTWVTNQNYVNSTTLTNTLSNYVLSADLASVATSGDYNDLINKPTEVTESTVSGWGFTKNTGTVTSVNNIQPVNGNVTLTIPDSATWGNITGTLSDQTDLQTALNNKYDASNPDGFISSASVSSLTDVDLTNVTNNQALLYNSTTQKWENKDVTITVDSALDNTSTNPVENRVIAQAIEDITLAKNPNLNLIGGNLIIDHGNVSEFSTTDYMQFPFVFNFNGYHWILEKGFTTGSDVTTQQNILDSYYGIAFAIRNGKFVLAISSNGSSWDIANVEGTYSVQANTAYSVKIAWDGTNYTLSYALDETNYTTDITVASALVHHSTQEYVGGEPELFGSGSQHPFMGTINLNNWKLTVNGLEVWLGMDDVGLGSRANIDLSNLTEAGLVKFQAPLISGENIKTINNNSILGSGDLTLDIPTPTYDAVNERITW